MVAAKMIKKMSVVVLSGAPGPDYGGNGGNAVASPHNHARRDVFVARRARAADP